MRFLDIAVAGLIGFSSIAVLAYQNPVGTDIDANRFLDESRIRDQIVSHVGERGFQWFQDTGVSFICADVQSMSNSTVAFRAIVDSWPCSSGPAEGTPIVNVTMATMARTVVIEGWQRDQR